jgi:hypothetical protein
LGKCWENAGEIMEIPKTWRWDEVCVANYH